MTTRIAKSNTYLNEVSYNQKTDAYAKKTIPSPQGTKRTVDAAFPSSENSRIAAIAFPISPPTSPKKETLEQRHYSTHFTFALELAQAMPLQPLKKSEKFQESTLNLNQAKQINMNNDAGGSQTQRLQDDSRFNFFEWSQYKPDFLVLQTTDLKSMPHTPRKKVKVELTVSLFQKQHETLCSNTFKYYVTYLAEGTYSNVYTLEDNEEPIIPGTNNADLVLKAYHGKNSGFGEVKLRGFLHNAIENYRAAVNAGLPVAEIYNVDTAEQDGYIIQRKILNKIDPLNAQQRLQISSFFDTSVKVGLLMDLKFQNFVLENGQVLLVDFIEDPHDEVDQFNKKIIEKWLKIYRNLGATKDQAKAYLNELSANHYQQFIQETLDQFA